MFIKPETTPDGVFFSFSWWRQSNYCWMGGSFPVVSWWELIPNCRSNKSSFVPVDQKGPRWHFGCKERSSHSSLLIVMRCIPSEPAIFHFCCNGAWFSTMPPPPSLRDSLSVHVHPLECWNVEIHLWSDSQLLYHLSLSSPDEDSCQKFVPFIGVRATWE